MTLIRPRRTARHRASGVGSVAAGDPGDAFPETRPMPPVRPDTIAGDFYGDEDLIKGQSEMFPGERVAMTVAAVTVVVLVATITLAQVTIALGWVWALALGAFAGACILLWAMAEAVHR